MSSTPNRAEVQAKTDLSLASVFDGIEPSLPESLFGEESRREMRIVADSLPMRLSSFWGFECRLGEPEPISDILFEIKKETSGPAILAGDIPSSLDGLCEAYPAWERFRALARLWKDPGHPWNDEIRNLWLEMDLAGSDAEAVLRRPNIFFGPYEKTPQERVFSLIEELMVMFERPACALQEFSDCLPEGARVFQIGFMLSRPDDAGLRMCVDKTSEEPEKILDWCAALRPGMSASEAESLKEVFASVFPLCRHVNFGFNLTEDGVGGVFGMECYEEWLEEDPAQWRPMLDKLTREGLCLPEKAHGAADYVGITRSPVRSRIDDDVIFLNTYRKIHHVKLTLSGGVPAQAKAYFSVGRPGLPLSMFGIISAAREADAQAGHAWGVCE
ncbi:MAG: hypothetical protein LBO21_02820 [Synergistaceae bacterium]|jgi:hypothetical protein|nr:hypothetical protein [Synergistaceae bacterium]